MLALVRLLAAICGRLSFGAAQRLGAGLGRLSWYLASRDRRRAREHLALALPEASAGERLDIARGSFRHFGITLGEWLHYLHRDGREFERHARIEGWEQVEAVRAAGRPILFVTGHVGSWELLGPLITGRGVRLAAFARSLDEPRLNELVIELRRHLGAETIERSTPGASRRLLNLLRDGGALAMLIDQDTRVEGVWVPFFGRPAYTPVGAAKFARSRGAAAIPMFLERQPDGSHLARFLPPLDLPDDEVEATALMTQAIEAQIRRRPEQWVWMHRRWRRRPPDEES